MGTLTLRSLHFVALTCPYNVLVFQAKLMGTLALCPSYGVGFSRKQSRMGKAKRAHQNKLRSGSVPINSRQTTPNPFLTKEGGLAVVAPAVGEVGNMGR